MSSLRERFEAKVSPEPMSGCWLWTGAQNEHGYGTIWADGRTLKAHRVGYELHVGRIAPGVDLDHKCHNRPCVNPSHLREATRRQNSGNLCGKGTDQFSSRFTGVSWHSSNQRWQATIKVAGRKQHLGYFSDETSAHQAYRAAANAAPQHPVQDGPK